MPTYTFVCPACEQTTLINLKVDKRNTPQECPFCHEWLKRKIGASLQRDIIEGNRPLKKKAVPPGTNLDTVDQAWARDR